MPASSLAAALNIGIYLLASGLFLGLALPVLDGVHKAAEAQAITTISTGLEDEVNSLVPGMRTGFVFGSPGAALALSTHGRTIVASMDGATLVETVRWNLPDFQLLPGRDYTLSLSGGAVSIEESSRR